MTNRPHFEPDRRRRSRARSDAFPTPAAIAERAYELFTSDPGRRERSSHEYWLRAEQELRDRAARRSSR